MGLPIPMIVTIKTTVSILELQTPGMMALTAIAMDFPTMIAIMMALTAATMEEPIVKTMMLPFIPMQPMCFMMVSTRIAPEIPIMMPMAMAMIP